MQKLKIQQLKEEGYKDYGITDHDDVFLGSVIAKKDEFVDYLSKSVYHDIESIHECDIDPSFIGLTLSMLKNNQIIKIKIVEK